ncbi:MAG: ECF-type sigma factor [Gemmatimonadales bacterium]
MPDADNQSGDITRLLHQAGSGTPGAFDRLLPLVYQELARIARGRLRYEASGHTLNTQALVHEAYLKLVDQNRAAWQSRQHFYAVASEAMRRILIDYAKGRRAAKRGGAARRIPLDEAADVADANQLLSDDQALELLALDDALSRLAAFNPDGATVVQYRFFGGLATEEVAEVMGVSERTVRRLWTVAKAWLRQELAEAIGTDDQAWLE